MSNRRNIIGAVFVFLLYVAFFYFRNMFNSIELPDPMSDGQAGIGIAVVGLLYMGVALLALLTGVIFLSVSIFRKKRSTTLFHMLTFLVFVLPLWYYFEFIVLD